MKGTAAALVAVALLPLAALPARAQTWSRTYAGGAGEAVQALGEGPLGELRVAAWTDSFGTATGDGWFLRLDADGNLLGESVAGDPDNGGVDGAAVASDGGALFLGRNVVNIFTKHDAWAMRVDASGSVAWGRLLAWVGFGRTFLHDAAEAVGGGWFVAGTSGMNDFPPQNAWLVKLDDLGNVLWQQEHGSGAADTPRSIIATADGGALIAGTTTFGGNEDILLAKYDSLGGLSWQWQLGGGSTDQAGEVVALAAGGYAVAAMSQSFTASGRAPWLLRFDDGGNLLWHRVFGDQEWGDLQALVETSDGDLVALGRISEPGFPTNDLWAVKVSEADGAVAWQRAYEGDSGDYGEAMLELSDGSLLLAGTWGWGFPEEALWLLKTAADGSMPGCDFVRDTALVAGSPRLTPVAGPLLLQPPNASDLPQAFVEAPGGAAITDRCATAACPPLSCDAILVSPVPACEGGDVTLFAEITGGEGALEVLWDVLPDPNIDASGNPATLTLGPGSHDLVAIVTDSCADPAAQQCTMMTTVVVHPDQTPVVTADGSTSFCASDGESVTLDAGPGHSDYQWLLGGAELPGETAETLVALASGDYQVRIVDANGCSWTSAPVSVDAEACAPCPPLVCERIEIAPEPACEGEGQVFTGFATGGEGALNFAWDFDGDGLSDAIGNPASWTYPAGTWPVALTVTDDCADPAAQSCTLQASATVHPDRSPTISPDGPTEFCAAAGESLNLDAGPGHVSHEWFLDGAPIPMSDAQVIPAAVSGSYSVTVVDANGCSWSSAPIVVVADACACAEPLACQELLVEPEPACEGGSQLFSVTYGGGLGPYEIAWDFDGDGAADAVGNPVSRTLPAGTTRVSVTVVDTGCPPFPNPGCTLQRDVLVEPLPVPTVSPDGPTSFCGDQGGSVTLTADPGWASYQWTRNGVDLPGETAELVAVTASGSYAVRVTAPSGCAGESAPVVVDAGDCGAACRPLICEAIAWTPGPACDERLTTLSVSVSGGEGLLAIEWDVDGDLLADAFGSPVAIRLPAGLQTVTVTVRDACSTPGPQECSLSEPIDVPSEAPPPDEVSDVRSGEPPLRVAGAGSLLVFEEEATALGFDVHVGTLGSWYGPRPAGATRCHVLDALSLGDGTASLAVELPAGSWVLVTAADPCFEGSAGTDSFAAPRDAAPDWEPCGPLP